MNAVLQSFAAILSAILLSASVYAQDVHHGDWEITEFTHMPGAFASTVNKEGELFGKFCVKSEDDCMWIIARDLNCVYGKKYYVVAISNAVSKTHDVVCVNFNDKPRISFIYKEPISKTVSASARISFLFPKKDGVTEQSSFSLIGANEALTALRGVLKNIHSASEPRPIAK